MSIMDSDPKYAKLYKWRWDHGFATDPDRVVPRKTPLRSIIVRILCDIPAYNFKPIMEAMDRLVEVKNNE